MEALRELSVCKHCERHASYKFFVCTVRLDPMAQSSVFAGVQWPSPWYRFTMFLCHRQLWKHDVSAIATAVELSRIFISSASCVCIISIGILYRHCVHAYIRTSTLHVQILSSFLRNSQNQSSGETGIQEFAICKHCGSFQFASTSRDWHCKSFQFASTTRVYGVQALQCKRLWLCESVVSVCKFFVLHNCGRQVCGDSVVPTCCARLARPAACC